jgi:hypothetical protein
MHEIKSFEIFQTAKVIAVLYLILGFVEGIIFAFAVSLGHHTYPSGGILFFLFGVPIIFGVLGFIMMVILCWLYNLIAARIGGIAFELVPRSEN